MFKPIIPNELQAELDESTNECARRRGALTKTQAEIAAARATVASVEEAIGAGRAQMPALSAARQEVERLELVERSTLARVAAADEAARAVSHRVQAVARDQAAAYVTQYRARCQPLLAKFGELLRQTHQAAIELEDFALDQRRAINSSGERVMGEDFSHLEWLAEHLAEVATAERIHPATHTRLSPNRFGTMGVMPTHGVEVGKRAS